MWCTFQTHFSMKRRHFPNMILRLKLFLSLSSFIWPTLYWGVSVSILQNYSSFEDQITRAKSKKHLYFFHYHLNLLICCKTELKIKFIFTEWIFLQSEFFLTELNFLKGDTNIYFKQIPLFEKKRFYKNHIFFLKIFFFQLSFATFEQP